MPACASKRCKRELQRNAKAATQYQTDPAFAEAVNARSAKMGV
jgi:hypothetical protein